MAAVCSFSLIMLARKLANRCRQNAEKAVQALAWKRESLSGV
jgi:hypothetical protein